MFDLLGELIKFNPRVRHSQDSYGCHSLIAIRTADSLPQVFKMLDDMLDEAGFTFIMGTCNEG